MSYKVTEAVLHSSRAKRGSRLVLCALAEVAAHDGTAWSPIGPVEHDDSIAYRAGLSTRQVMRCLQQLELIDELDIREWRQGRKLWNVYRIIVGAIREKPVNYERPELAARNLAEAFWTPEELLIPRVERPRQTRRLGDTLSPSQEPSGAASESSDGVTSATEPGDISDLDGVTSATESAIALRKDPVIGTVTEPETGETKIVSPVPASAGESELLEEQLRWALTRELGIVAKLTRSEHGAWGSAIADLVEVGATADDVVARCAAYRLRWPEMALTPIALVRHWNLLGAAVEISSPSRPVETWIEQTAVMFDPETAHELLDDRPGLDDSERVRLHELLDQRFAAGGEQRATA